MPARRSKYNLVEDAYDTRIPLHSDEAFQHGINFQAKYIGTLDVPRPSSRVEIVAAMRRIRYEFKSKGIKKKKVHITISVEGVSVSLRKKKKRDYNWNEDRYQLMKHAIYRVFYVSHDSQDLKIFSYIARDGQTNVFKCNVFKSHKKSHAMRIVRSIGQAFEVCHKLSMQQNMALTQPDGMNPDRPEKIPTEDEVNTKPADMMNHHQMNSGYGSGPGSPLHYHGHINHAQGSQSHVATSPLAYDQNTEESSEVPPLSIYHQKQLLQHQLQQQELQTQVALAQVQLLKDQLTAESSARLEAQARVQALMVHNKELVDHQEYLVQAIHELETRLANLNMTASISPQSHNNTLTGNNPFSSPPHLVMGQTESPDNSLDLPDVQSMAHNGGPGSFSPQGGMSPQGGSGKRKGGVYDPDVPPGQPLYHHSLSGSSENNEFNEFMEQRSRPVSGNFPLPDSLMDDMNRLNLLSRSSLSPNKNLVSSRDSQHRSGEENEREFNGNAPIVIEEDNMQDAMLNHHLEMGELHQRVTSVAEVTPVKSKVAQEDRENRNDGHKNNSNNSNLRTDNMFLSETSLDSNNTDPDTSAQSRRGLVVAGKDDAANNNSSMTDSLMMPGNDHDIDVLDLSAFEESADEEAKRKSGVAGNRETQLHISFSDDENSEDSGVPRPPRAIESMTLDDIEGLVGRTVVLET